MKCPNSDAVTFTKKKLIRMWNWALRSCGKSSWNLAQRELRPLGVSSASFFEDLGVDFDDSPNIFMKPTSFKSMQYCLCCAFYAFLNSAGNFLMKSTVLFLAWEIFISFSEKFKVSGLFCSLNSELFHDGGRYHIEISPLICGAD